MKTAVDKLLEYFIKEQKEGRSHWCIHDLIAQLYVAKEMEKNQIIDAFKQGVAYWNGDEWKLIDIEQYYNETFKSE